MAKINNRVHIKFGWGYDDTLGNKLKFTILASGFDVSVDTGGTVRVIEGKAGDTTAAEVSDVIVQAYGKDKIEDFNRQQETQNYYILSSDQLDSDQAIEMLERTPAFKRNKRKAGSVLGIEQAESDKKKPAGGNIISFDRDDK